MGEGWHQRARTMPCWAQAGGHAGGSRHKESGVGKGREERLHAGQGLHAVGLEATAQGGSPSTTSTQHLHGQFVAGRLSTLPAPARAAPPQCLLPDRGRCGAGAHVALSGLRVNVLRADSLRCPGPRPNPNPAALGLGRPGAGTAASALRQAVAAQPLPAAATAQWRRSSAWQRRRAKPVPPLQPGRAPWGIGGAAVLPAAKRLWLPPGRPALTSPGICTAQAAGRGPLLSGELPRAPRWHVPGAGRARRGRVLGTPDPQGGADGLPALSPPARTPWLCLLLLLCGV